MNYDVLSKIKTKEPSWFSLAQQQLKDTINSLCEPAP